MNDFTTTLSQYGLKGKYIETPTESDKQSKLPSVHTEVKAFEMGIKALFLNTPSTDNFYNMISNSPDSYGLEGKPSDDKIKKVIVDLINQDDTFSIVLLPLQTAQDSSIPFSVFPPENGESGNDFGFDMLRLVFSRAPIGF
jgi:hypothetical protein